MRFSRLFFIVGSILRLAYGRSLGKCSSPWVDLAQIPIAPRQEHTVVAINSTTLAVLGGIVQIGTTWNNTDLMTLYDISTDTWTSAAPLPIGLNHLNAAVVDGKIYLLGGLAEMLDANGTWRAIPDSWVYDPKDNEWTSITPVSDGTEKGSAAVGVYGKTIYLAGGLRYMQTAPGGTLSTVNEVSAFDTVTGSWTSFPGSALPQPRDHAGGAVVGSNFYVIGGRNINGRLIVSNTVFTLDLENIGAGWTASPATIPTARGGHATVAMGEQIYTFGGEGNFDNDSGVFNETEVFDTTTETWERLGPMKLPRHGTGAVAVEGKIYIPGGAIVLGFGPVNVTDVFTP